MIKVLEMYIAIEPFLWMFDQYHLKYQICPVRNIFKLRTIYLK